MPSHSELDTTKSGDSKEKMLQAWLDQNQYTRKGILRYGDITVLASSWELYGTMCNSYQTKLLFILYDLIKIILPLWKNSI